MRDNEDDIKTEPILVRGGQGRDDDMDGAGVILYGAVCLAIAATIAVIALCMRSPQ